MRIKPAVEPFGHILYPLATIESVENKLENVNATNSELKEINKLKENSIKAKAYSSKIIYALKALQRNLMSHLKVAERDLLNHKKNE